MTLKAIDVAKYVLSLTDTEKGQVISNLALQKLLYYCQGYYLAFTDGKEPLFEEDIVAWKYGPVVESVYYEYKDKGCEALPNTKLTKEEKQQFSGLQKKVIEFVIKNYSKYSAIGLMEKTHSEMPWRDSKKNAIIDIEKITSFFKLKVSNIAEMLFIKKSKEIVDNLTQEEIDKLPEYKFKYI